MPSQDLIDALFEDESPKDYFLHTGHTASDKEYNDRLLARWDTMTDRQKRIARLNAGGARITPNNAYKDT
jgi:hypothetical protein